MDKQINRISRKASSRRTDSHKGKGKRRNSKAQRRVGKLEAKF
jgi:hypothetical protein